MKISSAGLMLVLLFAVCVNAQEKKVQRFDKSVDIVGLDGQVIEKTASPVVGALYTNIYFWQLEDPVVGGDGGAAFAMQGGMFADSFMDGVELIQGGDFADFVDMTFPQNDIVSDESLCFLGMDPAGSGRNLYRLTTEFRTTAVDPQWDTLDTDADGDGILDTGDGIPDAPMPMDPPGLVAFAIDIDMNGMMDDPGTNPVGPIYQAGVGTPITFNADNGIVTVTQVVWMLHDFDGNFIDLDRNGLDDEGADIDLDGDGILDGLRTDVLVPVTNDLFGNWDGAYGLFFGSGDGDPTTIGELMSGELSRAAYAFDYLSDVIVDEFGKDVGCGFELGDVNEDGFVTLLDVGPFVDLITTGTFNCAGDFNDDGFITLLDVGPFVDAISGG